jgi:hypothetical protein
MNPLIEGQAAEAFREEENARYDYETERFADLALDPYEEAFCGDDSGLTFEEFRARVVAQEKAMWERIRAHKAERLERLALPRKPLGPDDTF